MNIPTKPSAYIGRFAPSPSGPLHMGSLVAALGSYLQAKSQQGRWLVRIEDIDPPREQAGSDLLILGSLQAHGLIWDGSPLYQSQQSALYEQTLKHLLKQKMAYYCQCTRKQIKASGGFYSGNCRNKNIPHQPSAIRFKNDNAVLQFNDSLQGLITAPPLMAREDFIIRRRDQLFAYNLAVVIDDRAQGITEIVRGSDLIEPTVRQLSLFNALNQISNKQRPLPSLMHLPLIKDKNGNKLSKQNQAPALDGATTSKNLVAALTFLGQKPEKNLASTQVSNILQWAINHWDIHKIPKGGLPY